MDGVMYSHKSTEWTTPCELFAYLNSRCNFDYDMACRADNALAPMFAEDTLSCDWPSNSRLYCNPPYGARIIEKFFIKSIEAAARGTTTVFLIPARTDTKCFHDYAARGRVYLLRGRLKFGGSNNSAPFPSCVVIIDKETIDFGGTITTEDLRGIFK